MHPIMRMKYYNRLAANLPSLHYYATGYTTVSTNHLKGPS